jgi:FkbM family methyltransferase
MNKKEPETHRRPLKEDSFRKLIEMGVPIGSILDVGVKTATYELLRVFPDKFHLLMEPIAEWNDGMKKNYSRGGVAHEIVNVAVSDVNGDVKLKTSTVHKDKPISHARIIADGDAGEGPEYRTVQARTLDSMIAERALAKPFLLKIDVDGAELAVLAGAKETLKDCSVVVIETGITNIVERAHAVQSAGFQPFDIVDISYYDDRFVQADMVFLNIKLIQERNLGVYRDGFDIAKWKNYIPT